MRNIIKIFIILITVGISISLAQSNEIKIRVDGLSCPFCAYGLEKKMNEIEGVENINVDIEEGLVTLKINNEVKVSEEEIRSKIKDAGFTPKEIIFFDENKSSGRKE